jgi:hypothetical protein
MVIGALELKLLKAWLLILTLFEVPEINRYLFQDANLDGFFSTLRNETPEKRVWCMVLVFLMMSRIQAAFFMHSPGVLIHTAAVHIFEAVVFGYEKIVYGGNGSNGILFCILANAIWFSSAAMRVDTN